MQIVTGRKLRKLSKIYNFGVDKVYEFITHGERFYKFKHDGNYYKMEFVEGNSYPYLFQIND